MKKFKSVLAGVLAGAMAIGMMATSASASESVAVASDGSFVLTVNTEGLFTTDESEYARGWFQTYGDQAPTVTKVTMMYDGAEVDLTSVSVLDGSDGNYTAYITPEKDKTTGDVIYAGYFEDASTLDKITSISYYVTLADYSTVVGDDGTEGYAVWSGGAVGTNSTAGWTSAGQWTTAVEEKEFVLSLPTAAADDAAADDATTDDAAADDTADSETGVADYSFLWIALAAAALTVAGTTVALKKRAEA